MSGIKDIGESIGNAVLDGIGRAAATVQERTPLPADLLESDEAYLAVFDAPGAEATDVSVRFEQDTLEVRIERFRGFHEGFEMRLPGRGMTLTGSVTFPPEAAVDPGGAEATVTSTGTLHVRVPKAENGGDRPVEIDTGEHEHGDGEADEHEHEHEDSDDHGHDHDDETA
jgi:HSP20 family molecular chaperone IbpA